MHVRRRPTRSSQVLKCLVFLFPIMWVTAVFLCVASNRCVCWVICLPKKIKNRLNLFYFVVKRVDLTTICLSHHYFFRLGKSYVGQLSSQRHRWLLCSCGIAKSLCKDVNLSFKKIFLLLLFSSPQIMYVYGMCVVWIWFDFVGVILHQSSSTRLATTILF